MNTEPDLTPDKRTDPSDKLLTIAEVAKRCQCSEIMVRRWIAAGRIDYVTLGDGKKLQSMIRVRESSLIKFWRENEREGA
jgi:excisionase family DNA binding protein